MNERDSCDQVYVSLPARPTSQFRLGSEAAWHWNAVERDSTRRNFLPESLQRNPGGQCAQKQPEYEKHGRGDDRIHEIQALSRGGIRGIVSQPDLHANGWF